MSLGTLRLRPIQGPVAYDGGWRRFWNLTWLIGVTDFKLTYFGSALGYLWSLMRPLLFFGVLYLVFTQVIKFGSGVKDYPVLLLLNIVLFSFLQEATGAGVAAVVNRENLVRKMQFPRLVIPVSTVLTALLNLGVNLLAVLVFMVVYGLEPRWTWLLLPVAILPLVALTAGLAMLLSALYVRYRDIAPIWGVTAQMLFYAAPIFYTVERVPESVRPVYASNPIAAVLEQARHWVVDPSAPSSSAVLGGPPLSLVPWAIAFGTLGLGLWYFRRAAPTLAEHL